MATLTTQQITQAGIAVSYTAAAGGGDVFSPGDHTVLRVKNGGGSSITATVNSVQLCNQGADHDLAVVVAAGAEEVIGPLPAARFANTSDGLVHVTYSGVTTVTVAVTTT